MAGTAPRGGYDYQFVKTPADTLICTVCFSPSNEPYLSECCGHTFCKSCLEGSKKFSNICPVCRSEDFKAIFNKQADRVIRSLHVFCTNKEQGCEWQCEVNDITSHLGNCLFQIIHCPNDYGESLQRQYLIIHVETECPRRRVNCQYCNDVGEYQFIEGQHKEECHKFPIQCPNKCEIKNICRDEVEEHREICPLEIIRCDYHVVGCKVKMTRKDINTHKQEMMEVHLSLSINKLMETKMQLKSTQNKLKHEVESTKHEIVKNLNQQLAQIEKNLNAKLIATQQEAQNNLKHEVEKNTTKLADTEHQLTATQQEMKKTKEGLTQRMDHVENHLSSTDKQLTVVHQSALAQLATIENLKHQLSASQQEAKTTKNQLLQKLAATKKELNTTKQQLAITCQNLTIAEKEHTTLAASTDKALTEMETKFQAKITEIAAAADKRITELETKIWFTSLQNRASKLASGNQVVPVVVKMTEFTKHMNTKWLSQPFYNSCNKECELQLEVATKLYMYNYYVSLCLIVEYKESKQSTDKFVVNLLNQIRDSEHHVGKNYQYFISHHNLYNKTVTCQYLKDDTLFFEVLKSKLS